MQQHNCVAERTFFFVVCRTLTSETLVVVAYCALLMPPHEAFYNYYLLLSPAQNHYLRIFAVVVP